MENLTVCWPIDQGSIKWWIIYLHLGAVFVYVVHSSFRHFHLLSIGATATEGCIPSTTILMIVRTHLREKQVYTSIKRLVYIQTNSTYEEVVREGGYLRVGLVIRPTVCDPKRPCHRLRIQSHLEDRRRPPSLPHAVYTCVFVSYETPCVFYPAPSSLYIRLHNVVPLCAVRMFLFFLFNIFYI